MKNSPTNPEIHAAPALDLNSKRHEFRKQLHAAKRAAKNLNECNRVPKPDRLRLAQNLGRMFERRFPNAGAGAMSELFRSAFDEESFDAGYWDICHKKRKRFILLDGEVRKEKEDHAKGAAYVLLAKAIAQLGMPVPGIDSEDAESLALSHLLYSTSFDENTISVVRMDQEHREELLTVFDRIVEEIERKVDLDRYRTQANSVGLGVPRSWPEEGELSVFSDNRGWGHTLDIPPGIDGTNTYFSRLAPRVHLCDVWSPIPIDSCAVIDVPAARLKRMGAKDAVQFSLYQALGLFDESEEDKLVAEGVDIYEEAYDRHEAQGRHEKEGVEEFINRVQSSEVDADAYNAKLFIKLKLYLEIRYAVASGRWMLALDLVPPGDGFSVPLTEIRLWANNRKDSEHLPGIRCDAISFVRVGADRFLLAETNLTYYLEAHHIAPGTWDLDTPIHAPVNGLFAGLAFLSGEIAFSLLLDPLEAVDVEYSFKVPDDYVPAPPNSLAYAILSNIAHEDDIAERLDVRLLADAELRAKKLDDFIEGAREAYRTALDRRWRPSDTG